MIKKEIITGAVLYVTGIFLIMMGLISFTFSVFTHLIFLAILGAIFLIIGSFLWSKLICLHLIFHCKLCFSYSSHSHSVI